MQDAEKLTAKTQRAKDAKYDAVKRSVHRLCDKAAKEGRSSASIKLIPVMQRNGVDCAQMQHVLEKLLGELRLRKYDSIYRSDDNTLEVSW